MVLDAVPKLEDADEHGYRPFRGAVNSGVDPRRQPRGERRREVGVVAVDEQVPDHGRAPVAVQTHGRGSTTSNPACSAARATARCRLGKLYAFFAENVQSRTS